MAIKPKQKPQQSTNTFLYPEPKKAGTQFGRVSLLIDLGTQERENFVDVYNENNDDHKKWLEKGWATIVEGDGKRTGKTCISKKLQPTETYAVFVDLVSSTVDYGGDIGEKHYRYMLNPVYQGDVKGFPLSCAPAKKAGELPTFQPNSVFYELALACGQHGVIGKGTPEENTDIELLLDKPLLINITVDKNVVGDRTYVNVKHKGLTEIMEGMDVPQLLTTAQAITFDNATVESVKFIRKDVREKITHAIDFKGSNMEKAFIAAGFIQAQASEQKQEENVPEAGDPFDGDEEELPY